jgi:DNA helicase HerA-like ATPase
MAWAKRQSMKLVGTVSSSVMAPPGIGSPTYDMVPFHIEAGYDPPLGAFVLIGREEDDTLFHYGRIVQAFEENIKADPWRLQRASAYGLEEHQPIRVDDSSPYRMRVALVELLGELVLDKDNQLQEVREPSLLPRTGAPVFELPVDLIPVIVGLPVGIDDGLHVGSVKSGGETANVYLPIEAVARHIAIVGRTGVGKSYAAHVLVEELTKRGIPVVSFDVLGDVFKMAEALGGLNLTAGADFKVPFSTIGLSEFLSFVNLTKDQQELVALAYDEVFNRALDALEATGTVQVELEELLNEIRSVAEQFGQRSVGDRAARRVEAAVQRSRLLEETLSDWPQKLADHLIINVYVGHLGQEARNLIVGASARLLQILRRKGYVPPFVMLLDEAHLFLPGGGETTPSTRVIRELVRTARHDAIGIILITQSPSSMDKQSLLTCNTRIVFALDPEDLRLISGMLGDLPEEVVKRIPRLSKGHAILVSGSDLIRHPVEVEIRPRRTPEGAPTPNLAEEVRKWKEKRMTNSGKRS